MSTSWKALLAVVAASLMGCGGGTTSTGTGAPDAAQRPDRQETPCDAGPGLHTLAARQANPGGLVVNGPNAYWWTFEGPPASTSPYRYALMTVPLCGGAPTTLVSGKGFPTGSLAANADHLYWTDTGASLARGSIVRMPLDGGEPSTVLADLMEPSLLVLDATHVYWAELSGSILKAPLGGGATVTLVQGGAADGCDHVPGIAVDGEGVYWTENYGGCLVLPPVVQRVGLGGGHVNTLASGSTTFAGIAVGPAGVFWANGDAVLRVPRDGGTVVTIATHQATALFVSLDATDVYWTTRDAVMKARQDGADATTLAAARAPGPIGLDPGGITWIEGPEVPSAFGSIVRLSPR